MPAVLRILDANANRAREALRVMEEAARFILNNAALSGQAKTLRHDLAAAMATLDGLELNRDTPGDVGTDLTTDAEQSRDSVAHTAAAASKRLTEALRSIEEYGKTLGGRAQTDGLATTIESLRYRAYELERQLTAALITTAPRQWRLCLLLTEALCAHHRWQDVLTGALDGGIDCVQVREKTMDGGTLNRRVQDVMAIVDRRATVIVNDRADVAMAAGADGVHLGQTDLPCATVRRLFGRQLIVGVSTSHPEQVADARAQGCDYVGLGPMFPTPTAPTKTTIVGPAYLNAVTQHDATPPHLAIGGITPDNAPQVLAAGARGLAVSSAICAAPDPAQAAARLTNLIPPTSQP